MDPVTVAATATALLLPYIKKGGEKFAVTLGQKLPEGVSKVWHAITGKFKGKPAAEESAKDLAIHAGDEDNQAAFRKELRKVLESDSGFASELERLLLAAGANVGSIVNTGSGAVATHGGPSMGQSAMGYRANAHAQRQPGLAGSAHHRRGPEGSRLIGDDQAPVG